MLLITVQWVKERRECEKVILKPFDISVAIFDSTNQSINCVCKIHISAYLNFTFIYSLIFDVMDCLNFLSFANLFRFTMFESSE